MTIRSAEIEDAERLLEIYSYYVKNTAVSFECKVPSLTEFTQRIENTLKKYPYIVLEENGRIQGYAYAGAFYERQAYDHCCELSIYLDKDARRKGFGRKLYDALEEKLRMQGILNLYACIASPICEDEYLTKDSEMFHSRLGYRTIGIFHQCGYKFGRWYDMIYMEKMIGKHI